ncbi:MAG: M20/M25/M40 family metallo-hydrolase [Rhizonema sp. NSF051]|nr:M20/M25/M40 family metallo-hydrolase [Rhizonema sp. NSF051]
MKKWIWLMLLVLMTVAVVYGSVFVRQHEVSVFDSIRFENPLSVKKEAKTPVSESQSHARNADISQVSAENLFAHIQKLYFTRYTPVERSRTRAYITTELKKLGWKPKLEKFSDGINIIAEQPGTEKAAGTIIVAAHYDTIIISPGADDNASGVAVLLEIARILSSHSHPRTLQLVFFDREEEGLLGSKAFVKNKAHLQNLHGVIVMDMVGYSCHTTGCQKYPKGLLFHPVGDKGDFVAVVGDAEHMQLLKAFQNSPDKDIPQSNLPPILTLPVPLKGLLTPDVLRSDHAPFWYQGIGAVLVTDTANLRTPHYHQPSDVPATIDREFFAGAAQVVVNATITLLKS